MLEIHVKTVNKLDYSLCSEEKVSPVPVYVGSSLGLFVESVLTRQRGHRSKGPNQKRSRFLMEVLLVVKTERYVIGRRTSVDLSFVTTPVSS